MLTALTQNFERLVFAMAHTCISYNSKDLHIHSTFALLAFLFIRVAARQRGSRAFEKVFDAEWRLPLERDLVVELDGALADESFQSDMLTFIEGALGKLDSFGERIDFEYVTSLTAELELAHIWVGGPKKQRVVQALLAVRDLIKGHDEDRSAS